MSDGEIRFTWTLAILSLAGLIQQYFEGNTAVLEIGCFILFLVCIALLVRHYHRAKSPEGAVEESKRTS
jgi:hypothetical protein